MNIAGTLAGQYGQIGAQQAQAGQALGSAQTGYGSMLAGLGAQAQQAGAQDVAGLQAIGGQSQQLRQQQLDAQRAGLLQAQQAPLAQYKALMPFMQMVPQGAQQTSTTYTPPPNALNAGLAAGLGALGTMQNFNNPTMNYGQYQQPPSS